jgi:hypothetical protein
MTSTRGIVRIGLLLVLLGALAVIGNAGMNFLAKSPCDTPKTWSLGSIDPRFGLSTSTVLSYAKLATNTWNNAYATNTLLSYQDTGGDIVLSFVYDERQQTTSANEKLQETISGEKQKLDDLKQTIESLRAEYATLETKVTAETEDYNQKLASHNTQVNYWNAQGGAPSSTYLQLQHEGAALEKERQTVNADIARYNQLGTEIQTYAKDHNEVVSTINSKVDTLNKTALREFEEGTYDPVTHAITIYEFADTTSLKRVLIHEFGHAIGLQHVADKNAIMYPINIGTNLTLTSDDRAELARICNQKGLSTIVNGVLAIRDGIFRLAESSWHDIAAQAR